MKLEICVIPTWPSIRVIVSGMPVRSSGCLLAEVGETSIKVDVLDSAPVTGIVESKLYPDDCVSDGGDGPFEGSRVESRKV